MHMLYVLTDIDDVPHEQSPDPFSAAPTSSPLDISAVDFDGLVGCSPPVADAPPIQPLSDSKQYIDALEKRLMQVKNRQEKKMYERTQEGQCSRFDVLLVAPLYVLSDMLNVLLYVCVLHDAQVSSS